MPRERRPAGGCCRNCLDRVKAINKAAGTNTLYANAAVDAAVADAEFVSNMPTAMPAAPCSLTSAEGYHMPWGGINWRIYVHRHRNIS